MIPDSNDCSIPIATAFYPSLSLLNHSCDPNIQIIFKNGIECFVRSNRTIRSNEQIFNCYGINYRSADYKQRQQLLSDQYFFHCKCQICKNESKKFEKRQNK
ncbi:SET and MYND domain-containing protein 4 [Dermatophagoides pteronyssinus]|uniref:SET and MYND domain-containing protein 4 n=1 Tax=Dermatophagoides pteronyssinus TaxID=6956 RepID=A0ABQ8J8X2_DERPT|nr:SET and MYND domain-containing protein 4 [Dermatophagoides pteronyssinus]